MPVRGAFERLKHPFLDPAPEPDRSLQPGCPSRFAFRSGRGLKPVFKTGRKEKEMRKTILALWAVLLLMTMTLSGCIVPFWGDEGRGHGGGHERGGEHEHHGER